MTVLPSIPVGVFIFLTGFTFIPAGIVLISTGILFIPVGISLIPAVIASKTLYPVLVATVLLRIPTALSPVPTGIFIIPTVRIIFPMRRFAGKVQTRVPCGKAQGSRVRGKRQTEQV